MLLITLPMIVKVMLGQKENGLQELHSMKVRNRDIHNFYVGLVC